VRYKVTASHTWTGFTCAIIEFQMFNGVGGIITGAVNTVTSC
jgi:hypothetical protein